MMNLVLSRPVATLRSEGSGNSEESSTYLSLFSCLYPKARVSNANLQKNWNKMTNKKVSYTSQLLMSRCLGTRREHGGR